MFHGESPYRRSSYRPRMSQAAGLPPGAIPTAGGVPPMPVSAPVGQQPPPATVPPPAPAVVPSAWPDKLLLGGGTLLGAGVAWLGFTAGSSVKNTAAKVAAYGIGGIGAVKALWDLGSLLGWPANRFPA